MSFTMVVKDEASKIETTRLEDISELSAIIRIAGNINNNINVFGVSANCLMEARSSEEETESGRELVFFRHIDLLSAYLQ